MNVLHHLLHPSAGNVATHPQLDDTEQLQRQCFTCPAHPSTHNQRRKHQHNNGSPYGAWAKELKVSRLFWHSLAVDDAENGQPKGQPKKSTRLTR